MFLCELIDSAAGTIEDLGLLSIPVIGDLLMTIIELLWSVLGC